MSRSANARAGVAAVVPMLVGVVPFGLVAGAAPVSEGFDGWTAVGLSTVVFAGAAQLAVVDILGDGGSVLVAVAAAWAINLRLVLYSASIAPYLADRPLPLRMGVAYLLTDQAYALSVTRWSADPEGAGRLAYYLGAGGLLWVAWQLSTLAGVALGGSVPEDLPLDFALPLVFLVLLVPLLASRPSLVAAAVGGTSAVVAAETGAGPLSVIVGALSGIVAGTMAERHTAGEGRAEG